MILAARGGDNDQEEANNAELKHHNDESGLITLIMELHEIKKYYEKYLTVLFFSSPSTF